MPSRTTSHDLDAGQTIATQKPKRPFTMAITRTTKRDSCDRHGGDVLGLWLQWYAVIMDSDHGPFCCGFVGDSVITVHVVAQILPSCSLT
eukprot:gene13392-3913_t